MQELEDQAAAERVDMEAFRRLLTSPEWLVYERWVDAQANEIMQRLVVKAAGLTDGLVRDGLGQVRGLDRAKSLPRNVLEMYNQRQQVSGQESETGGDEDVDNPIFRTSPIPDEE